jgi:hypothetical protein
MSVIITANTQVVTVEKRTRWAMVNTPKGENYTLTLLRETRYLDANGSEVGPVQESMPTTIVFNDIVNETVTVTVNGSPLTLKVSDITNFMAAYFDQKATELNI